MNEQDEIDWFLSLKQTILDGETEDALQAIDGAIKLRQRELASGEAGSPETIALSKR